MVRVVLIGAKVLSREMRRAAKRLPAETERRLRHVSEFVVGDAKRQFKGERTRALYRIAGGRRKKRKHPRPVTSPPKMLGVFTGQYRKAISFAIERTARKTVRSVIGAVGIPYSRRHELGTGGMPKRPVLEPAVEKNKRRIASELGRVWRTVLR